ncbi:TonB C-terminal domain-containing protein [Aquabacterium sp.]|uniref:TonB C-terminal domain-containing protein n=1 Tax=Aquabacterium sp. TaxID=1872578 RepID=UPI003D6D11FE
MSQADKKSTGRWIAALVGVLLLSWAGYWAATGFKKNVGGPKRQTVKIAVLPDTPPPPPPKVEKPPEPEKQETKPQPQQDQPKVQQASPEPQQLKMDGPAGDGPSAFASGQVSSEYKGGEIGTGNGGGNRLQFSLFASQLQRHIQASLARNNGIKLGDYRVNVRVWLTPAGELRVELASPSGDDKTDEALKQAFTQLPAMSDVPSNLPQPIRLRITNRMTG